MTSSGDQVAPAVMTVDELAALLRVGRKAVYAAIAAGDIPGVVRVGRCVRIDRATVLAWMSGQVRVSRASR